MGKSRTVEKLNTPEHIIELVQLIWNELDDFLIMFRNANGCPVEPIYNSNFRDFTTDIRFSNNFWNLHRPK